MFFVLKMDPSKYSLYGSLTILKELVPEDQNTNFLNVFFPKDLLNELSEIFL